ncbi:ABC-F family ATP-binding cassette domain-containing protein [Pseudenhygromyxa sp. WMMC2535]|uniref:ABC-F family ATP-binding cassette domain-containing protein n=1 Tax=Pseudenhygromyxa sp. WMMC2535 TaxID=2712867 RepID=UPI001556F409|nr:ABC-F family ATP-binding cassette domain-containing protein [Pseudenhygromyxa sp. WMMC2535]NVB41443.1 ABC-F family ATP-binding cassette domain-containing protein [Pseudenhygromyxa sp. WMMC2535]
MTILSARGIRRTYGIREVLRGANMSIAEGERVGMVGKNGGGKSTLARILAGAEPPDEGEVIRRTGLRVGYLAQEPEFEPGMRAVDAVLAGLKDWQAAIDRHAEVSRRLGEGAQGKAQARLLDEQAELAARIERLGGWEQRHEALAMLGHLGVVDPDAAVDTMSGGERRRVALARLLIANPELAILDEPTNHLDLETVEWLERWLVERFTGALLLVTHDRFLLDRVATRTLEVDEGEVYSYEGGWSRYLEAKAEREAHADRVEANRRNFLRRELEWLRRQPKARGTKQKARTERAEAARDTLGPKRERAATIEMGHVREGKTILEADDLDVSIGERALISGLTLRLSKGDRFGIVGPNGCGKTTLMRVLSGELELAGGELRVGKRTKVAFLRQTRAGLDDQASIFDNVGGGSSVVELGDQSLDLRSYLERFLFSSHDQRRLVGTLSGGERARVALAKTLREGANLVILDEPTNDLDVMTLTALEGSLLEYPGAVLLVTHDRWFLDRVATALLVFEGGAGDEQSSEGEESGGRGPSTIVRHEGGWSDYLERRQQSAREEAAAQSASKASKIGKAQAAGSQGADAGQGGEDPRPRKLTYGERLELEGLLERVDEAEQVVAALDAKVAEAGFYEQPVAEQQAVFAELEQARADADALAERWAELEALA